MRTTLVCAWMLWALVVHDGPSFKWHFTGKVYESLLDCRVDPHKPVGTAFGKNTAVADAQCYPSDFDPREKN